MTGIEYFILKMKHQARKINSEMCQLITKLLCLPSPTKKGKQEEEEHMTFVCIFWIIISIYTAAVGWATAALRNRL